MFKELPRTELDTVIIKDEDDIPPTREHPVDQEGALENKGERTSSEKQPTPQETLDRIARIIRGDGGATLKDVSAAGVLEKIRAVLDNTPEIASHSPAPVEERPIEAGKTVERLIMEARDIKGVTREKPSLRQFLNEQLAKVEKMSDKRAGLLIKKDVEDIIEALDADDIKPAREYLEELEQENEDELAKATRLLQEGLDNLKRKDYESLHVLIAELAVQEDTLRKYKAGELPPPSGNELAEVIDLHEMLAAKKADELRESNELGVFYDLRQEIIELQNELEQIDGVLTNIGYSKAA